MPRKRGRRPANRKPLRGRREPVAPFSQSEVQSDGTPHKGLTLDVLLLADLGVRVAGGNRSTVAERLEKLREG